MTEYAPAPAGTINCEIVAASIGDVVWRASDDNPRGECLKLRLRPEGNFAFVFADVPLDWGRMLDAVAASLGIDRQELVPGNLVGKQARVVLKHYTAKDGSTRAAVAKWLPASVEDTARSDAPPAPAKSEPRKPAATPVKVSRNAPPQWGDEDDIPF